ncbi:hypothetical protein D046_0173B, partial [Vibrio parahaemolyticus V-223/04]
SW